MTNTGTGQFSKVFFSAAHLYWFIGIWLLSLSLFGCRATDDRPSSNMAAAREAKKDLRELRDAIGKIRPFFKPMAEPGTSDWLAAHNEPGQTFEEYLDSDPTRPDVGRQKIYILPLGIFTAKQQKVIDRASEYLAAFYDLPVEMMASRELSAPGPNFRNNRLTHTRQVRTGFILDTILTPDAPV